MKGDVQSLTNSPGSFHVVELVAVHVEGLLLTSDIGVSGKVDDKFVRQDANV